MTSPAKAKGDRAERAVVEVLRAAGIPADRAYGAGRRPDHGDIDGLPGRYIQVRYRKEIRAAAWWQEACAVALRLRMDPVLVIGIMGLPAGTWIVWHTSCRMRLEDWAKMVAAEP